MGLEEALAIWEVPHEEPSLEAVREKRLDRIQRIVLVCLGAIEAVLKFLCGFHHDEEQGGEGGKSLFDTWYYLPSYLIACAAICSYSR